MKIEDLIEGLNKHIEDIRSIRNITSIGHLVLQKVIEPHSVFKAYKTYKNILWFIKGKERYKVLGINHTDKVLKEQEEFIKQHIDIELCHLIFNWIGSSLYEEVIKGEYNGISEDTCK